MGSKRKKKPSTSLIIHEGIPVEAEEIKKPETLTIKIGFKPNWDKILNEMVETLKKKGLLKPK